MTHKPSDEMNLQEIADQQVIYWRHKAKKAEAEADRLRAAIEQHREDIAVFEGAKEDDAWSWHQALWAALDGEDDDGLAEIAHISEDADLYRKTDGVILRREGEA